MFVLSKMTYTVRIPPYDFNKKLVDAVTEEINRKLANKVVLNVGLCVALWDIQKIEDSHIIPGDGAAHTKVHFRVIVFRPFMEEILIGKIRACSQKGIYVSLGFFDDILIGPECMQHPSRFEETEQLWMWEYNSGDGPHNLQMEIGEMIRFRVTDEEFFDTTPSGPDIPTENLTELAEEKKAPYQITGTINEPGLGLLSWWSSD